MNRINGIFKTLFISLTILLGALFFVLILSLFFSFFDIENIKKTSLSEILFAVRLSILTATISACLSIIIAIPVSYTLSRYKFYGREMLNTLFDMTNVLSPIAIGAMVLVFFNTLPGRFIEKNLEIVFEVKGIIIAQFLVIISYAVRFIKNSFDGIDEEYEIIGRTLGGTSLRVFTYITLPMVKRGILSALLFVWARAIGEFGATITLAGATTMKTETLPVAIFLNFESADIGTAVIFIMILLIISLSVLFISRKLLRVT